MAFGWFSKDKNPTGKALEKARKLEGQGRWAEALTYFDEALAADAGSEAARGGARTCRERLVAFNLEEAEAYRASDADKAREHARLAMDLAGAEEDLRARAWQALDALKTREAPKDSRPAPPAPPKRLFASSCSCATPCHDGGPEPEPEHAGGIDVEDLAEFYLDACDPAEREAFGALGDTFRQGFVSLHQGELKAARPALEAAAREAPSAPGAHYALGLLEALEGRGDAAVMAFQRALKAEPGFAPAARHLADLFREARRPAESAAFLRQWLQNQGDDAEARLLLAICLLEAGDPAAARPEAEAARRRLGEGDVRPALVAARAHRAEGNLEKAAQALQAVVAKRPDAVDALMGLGEVLLDMGGGSAERAAEVFKRCYQLDPDRGWWHLVQVARAYAARGWRAEAEDVLARAGRELPDADEARQAWEAARASLQA